MVKECGVATLAQFHRWQPLIAAAVDLRDFQGGRVSSANGPTSTATVNDHFAAAKNLVSSAERLLAADPKALRKAIRLDPCNLPKWVTDLIVLLSFLEDPQNGLRRVQVRSREHQFLHLPLCIPVVRFAANRLEETCSRGLLEQLAPQAHHKLRSSLALRLLRAIRPAAENDLIEMEGEQMRTSGIACNGVAQETRMIRDFFQPSPEFRLLRMFKRFPALARLMTELALDWTDGSRELLERLQKDKRLLIQTFGKQRRCRKVDFFVRDLHPALGDRHRSGRSVTALSLRGGGRIIYKPRSCRGEWEWRQACQQLRDKSLRPRTPQVILRNGWGWVEFIETRSCRDKKAVGNFYRRAGAVLCLAHLFRATDLHRGNLIAAGAHPVVVDLETLWSAQTNTVEGEPLALTSLLPSADAAGSIHWSAFGWPAPEEANDDMDHLPRLAGKFFRATNFLSEIEGGFCDAAVALLGSVKRRKRLAAQRNRIARNRWRRVYASTEAYAALQEDSITPELLRDALSRFLAIARACKTNDTTPDIAFQEAAALSRLDIPYFLSDPKAFGARSIGRPRLLETLRKLPELHASLLATVFSDLSHGQFDTARAAPPCPSCT